VVAAGCWWLVAACAACAYATYFAATYSPPHLLFLLSAGLRVTVGAATDPYYHPLVLTSPPFRRSYAYTTVPCSHRLGGPLTQLTTAPPTYHSCSRPASGSLLVLLPIPTTTPLSYPVTSPPFRRLLCLHYGALQPPTWWSSYAANYSPPTHYFCTRPPPGRHGLCCPLSSPPLLPLPRRQLTLLSPPVSCAYAVLPCSPQ
jgi:hypothetical protein